MKHPNRVHVMSLRRKGRLVCGRKDTGQELVDWSQAAAQAKLCQKCRRNLAWERRLSDIRRAPKPGVQLRFAFVKEY